MIKQFRNGAQINYTYNGSGEVGISVSNNVSCYIFSGSGVNNLKNYLVELKKLNENVLTLSADCFNGCANLVSVNLQDTRVNKIENGCFANCGNLTSFIPSLYLTEIPNNCFQGDSKFRVLGKMSQESDNSKYV